MVTGTLPIDTVTVSHRDVENVYSFWQSLFRRTTVIGFVPNIFHGVSRAVSRQCLFLVMAAHLSEVPRLATRVA